MRMCQVLLRCSQVQYCDSVFGRCEFRVVHSGSTLSDLAVLTGGVFAALRATEQWLS